MINKLLEKELKGIYDYEFKDNSLYIYPVNNKSEAIYEITNSGIGGYERGKPVFIADFGSLDNNILAFTIKQGKSSEEYNAKVKKLRDEVDALEDSKSDEEIIKSLGLDKIVEEYFKNNNDITVSPFKKNISKIYLNKDNLQSTIFLVEENTTNFYLDIIDLIVKKTYVENLIKDNMFDINTELLMQIISYSVTGLNKKVRNIQNMDNYTK